MLKVIANCGEHISDTARRACKVALIDNQQVEMVFNDISVIVSPESYFVDIGSIYSLKALLLQSKG